MMAESPDNGNVSLETLTGKHVQAFMFDRAKYSLVRARKWLKENGYKARDYGSTIDGRYVFLQRLPDRKKYKYTNRTIRDGIIRVTGQVKG